jgi:hypothetical protein
MQMCDYYRKYIVPAAHGMQVQESSDDYDPDAATDRSSKYAQAHMFF